TLAIASSLLWTVQSCGPPMTGVGQSSSAHRSAADVTSRRMVTARPAEIDDILYNPGMGFADFHFGIGPPLPVEQHPRSTVAYVRWYWPELEPAEGQYNFALVDGVIEQARAAGETLAFRMMTVPRVPAWLLAKGVASVKVSGGVFPD